MSRQWRARNASFRRSIRLGEVCESKWLAIGDKNEANLRKLTSGCIFLERDLAARAKNRPSEVKQNQREIKKFG